MDKKNSSDGENDVKVLSEKLKLTENKLNSVIDLVYKTFSGDESAAKELSNIVGLPPPILYCDDNSQLKSKLHENIPLSYTETNKRISNRLEFLNKVMDDHDKMMTNSNSRPISKTRNNRVRSADRILGKTDQTGYSSYARSLFYTVRKNFSTDNSSTNLDPIFKHRLPSPNKPLLNKPIKSRTGSSHSKPNDNKKPDGLHHPSSRRSLKSQFYCAKPTTPFNDFKFMSDSEVNMRKPPKPNRPTSSMSQCSNSSDKAPLKMKITPSSQNLQKQKSPVPESENKTEELLKAMEKRFALSTIDLQRRLGICKAGMVGP